MKNKRKYIVQVINLLSLVNICSCSQYCEKQNVQSYPEKTEEEIKIKTKLRKNSIIRPSDIKNDLPIIRCNTK